MNYLDKKMNMMCIHLNNYYHVLLGNTCMVISPEMFVNFICAVSDASAAASAVVVILLSKRSHCIQSLSCNMCLRAYSQRIFEYIFEYDCGL